ncbi:MAG TPA: TA system VapC family ribonuclease toxin [Nitrospiraceae bacterium]|nr:TA system VapC family ribonuclease toxin [Nitrospiraceae bacterium]
MFVVDTNVLVYAADEDSPAHLQCRRLLEQWRHQHSAWYVTWSILYEFLRISTHPKVLRTPWVAGQAWQFIEALLASPGLEVLVESDRHAAVAEHVLRDVPSLAGNLFHDAHTAVLMQEHGVRRIYTRDTDFHRFQFLEVIDPLRAST